LCLVDKCEREQREGKRHKYWGEKRNADREKGKEVF